MIQKPDDSLAWNLIAFLVVDGYAGRGRFQRASVRIRRGSASFARPELVGTSGRAIRVLGKLVVRRPQVVGVLCEGRLSEQLVTTRD
ncbi:MAG: hypothetical protein H0X28_15455 [Solirubrobacterales bacterium]|nr:hypothetical protein [Solirubrobacterales bacterium]